MSTVELHKVLTVFPDKSTQPVMCFLIREDLLDTLVAVFVLTLNPSVDLVSCRDVRGRSVRAQCFVFDIGKDTGRSVRGLFSQYLDRRNMQGAV